MGEYDDIINLKRPNSKYPKMSRISRAAQFASFKALTGHEESLDKKKESFQKSVLTEVEEIENPEIFDDVIDKDFDI